MQSPETLSTAEQTCETPFLVVRIGLRRGNGIIVVEFRLLVIRQSSATNSCHRLFTFEDVLSVGQVDQGPGHMAVVL